jgi:hypothetical protein
VREYTTERERTGFNNPTQALRKQAKLQQLLGINQETPDKQATRNREKFSTQKPVDSGREPRSSQAGKSTHPSSYQNLPQPLKSRAASEKQLKAHVHTSGDYQEMI